MNTKIVRGTSVSSTMSGGFSGDKSFSNPTFERAIQEEKVNDVESTDEENPDLLEVDETLFENPTSDVTPSSTSLDMAAEGSDCESEKWRYTVTFNWARKNQSRESLNEDTSQLQSSF